MADRPRIVQISTRDIHGGAARAAYRVHQAVRSLGGNSTYFVRDQTSADPTVRRFIPDPSPVAVEHRARAKIALTAAYDAYAATRSPDIELFSQERVDDDENFFIQRPIGDIYNLHWIAGFVDEHLFFTRTRTKAPVVWTLHDQNPFTGGCHYDQGCGLFAARCGPCPLLGSHNPDDLSRRVFDAKARILADWPAEMLHIVAPSRWLTQQARDSALFAKFDATCIPNPVEIDVFKPGDKAAARAAFGLPPDMRIVLFVSNHIRIARKGFRELVKALSLLPDADKVMLVGVGDSHVLSTEAPFRIGQIEFLADDAALARLYVAADVTAIPSRQDNLPNTILESLSCGTPVVGFAVGGVPDVVETGVNGFLAPPGNVAGLSLAFMEAFSDMARLRDCGVRGRARIERDHAPEVQGRAYLALYEQVITRAARGQRIQQG